MKQLLLLVVSLSMAFQFAQAQVSIGSLTPGPGAQLDVVSTDKGILIPRVTSTAAVTATSEGLLVYQTAAPAGFYVRKAGSWVRLATTEDTPGTLIQYASGKEEFLLSELPSDHKNEAVAVLGFGNFYGLGLGSLTVINPRLNGFASSLSRAGALTSISASFVNSIEPPQTFTPISIKAQVYTDSGTGSLFSALSGAEVSFSIPGCSPVGTTVRGMITGLNIPLTAQTRFLLVYSCNNIGLRGYGSAGITIK